MGFVSDFIGASGSDDAANTYKYAAGKWDDLATPSAEELAKKAKALYDSGVLTPDQYTAALQDPSSLEKFVSDPRLRDAQMKSLDYLSRVGSEGGMTAEDRARLNEIENRNATIARGGRGANTQRMAARGMGGSGMEAVNNMIADQGAATENYMGGTEVAANAERRALDAMTRAGEMGGNIRGQDFSEAERKAAAADRINQFNAQNKNVAMAGNVDAKNNARRTALGLEGDDFERQRQKLAGWTGAYTGQAPYQERSGQQTGEGVGGMLSFIPTAMAGGMMSDERVKEDVAPAEPDLEEFLATLKPSKWEYKNPEKYGEGTKYGVMAQDMEKSPVGKSFVSKDAEGVKRIDYGAAHGVMLSILKDLSDRLDNVEGRHGAK